MLKKFRAINERLNSLFFNPEGYLNQYRSLIREHLTHSMVVIHLGAGQGKVQQCWHLFPEDAPDNLMVVSLDLDWAHLKENPSRYRVAGDAHCLPLASGSVALIASEHTFEHLPYPERALAECHRILRVGGSLIFAVPNKLSYISLLALLTPMRFHRWIYRLSGNADNVGQMCRKFYRFNTTRRISSLAPTSGFRVKELRGFVGAPCYTSFLPPPFHLVFILWHKVLERFQLLQSLRINWVGLLVKTEA